ncbi:MAG TPA: guanitoxin biosynthesis pre-guanitoxin forming N-methyltransferase GntF, partial [Solirubrobacteraceae bacterium]|nr:guanitoxin biosynthesis pre-guanitoxin forming N-methyltransferase GntF [Solirubrobacteraceae bacterium]
SEIHLADYLPANLEEIERWRTRAPGAHDWRPFVRYTLQCEGLRAPTDEQITRREELTRSKITRLLEVDARHPVPLDQHYATVISAYCADSATDDRATWETLMANITALVAPDGLFLTAALRRCRSYVVGDKQFPSASVDEHDLRRVLTPRFSPRLHVRDLQGHEQQGYSSIVLADARRRAPDLRPTRGLRSGILISRGHGLGH